MSDAGRTAVSVVVISKDEPALADTLARLRDQRDAAPFDAEILVVDASSGRLDEIRRANPDVAWVDFERPPGVRISIPHQRNAGVGEARGEIVVFTDCGCTPEEGWLERIVHPLLDGEERLACGRAGATGPLDPYVRVARRPGDTGEEGREYLRECSTINLAVRRDVFDEVGGFDEAFEYGSDVDFSWRVVHRGIRIRYLPDAVVRHDWGSRRRQLRRSFAYGKARARLFAKHVVGRGPQSIGKRSLNDEDLVYVAYPAFLLGLPVALRFPAYLLVLLLPLWRNRRHEPAQALADHLVQAAGVLSGVFELLEEATRHRRGATAAVAERW